MRLTARARRMLSPLADFVQVVRDPYGLFDRYRHTHGDLFELRLLGFPPIWVCGDPEGARELLASSYADTARFPGGAAFFVDRGSLMLLDDEPHRVRRRQIARPFNAESVRAFGPTMLTLCDRVLDRLPLGRPLPLAAAMHDITMRSILRCIFGIDEGPRLEELRDLFVGYLRLTLGPDVLALGAARGPEFAHAVLDRLSRRARSRSTDVPLVPSRIPLLRSADRLGRIRALLDAEIERRTAEGVESRDDVLSRLLLLRFDDGQTMSRDELLAQLLMLVIGGYDTTAQALCWAVYCLMHHPEALAKLRAELDGAAADGLDPARLRELDYLGAVIAESMRLYPLALGVTRVLRKPVLIAGRELQPGTVVMASMYLVQRHPSLWPDPQRFQPERMLERRPAPHVLFPFGAGAWRCLGAALAEYEMRILLARLLTRFDVRPDPTVDVRPVYLGITIGPTRGLPVILTPRGPAPTAT